MPGARLSQDEREEIGLGLAVQRSFADIARQLDRPTSTVAREVEPNGGRASLQVLKGAAGDRRPGVPGQSGNLEALLGSGERRR